MHEREEVCVKAKMPCISNLYNLRQVLFIVPYILIYSSESFVKNHGVQKTVPCDQPDDVFKFFTYSNTRTLPTCWQNTRLSTNLRQDWHKIPSSRMHWLEARRLLYLFRQSPMHVNELETSGHGLFNSIFPEAAAELTLNMRASTALTMGDANVESNELRLASRRERIPSNMRPEI